MKHGVVRLASTLALAAAFLVAAATSGYAQGSFFSSITGMVVDTSGGVMPGADVKVKNTGTGEEYSAVTASDGSFTIPSLPGGTYSVTVSLMGFRTVTLNAVTLNAAVPASVKVTMEVGTLQENVTVVGESAMVVQTQSPAIAANLSGTQISSLPLTSRNALDSLTSLPGFNTSGTARNSTINGLPKSAINISLDGMNVQDNYLKTSDGYFARLTPSIDSVEEVTVTMAGNTADATGQGGVQIKFVTKSGSNKWTGTAYEYYRTDKLNANTWFNNRDLPADPATGKAPKAQLNQYQQGFAQGGPIVKNKAFFFVNYEDLRQPSNSTLQRTILTPSAASGTFSYNTSSGVRSVNLLQLAAANGQLSTLDPAIAQVMNNILSDAGKNGSVASLSNPIVQQYTWQMNTNNFNPSPTFRIDYDVSQKHRLTGSMNYRHINSTPDTTNSAQLPFPSAITTGSQQSTRWTTSESLRSTFTTNLVNEFRVGATGGATYFSPELNPSMWTSSGAFNQNGYRLNFNGTCCGTGFLLTNPGLGSGQSSREAGTKVVEDTATWIKGKHSVNFGGSMVQADVWLRNQTLVPTVTFGLITGESAISMFNTTNFPGASSTDLTNAQNLYALLTGRMSSITGNATIAPDGSQYVPLGQSLAQGRLRQFDFYAMDSWRWKSNVTVNVGLRYMLQNPFYPVNNSYTTATLASLCGISGVNGDGCNLFQPGVTPGSKPNFIQLPAGTYAYNADKNNFAPSAGFAWTPTAQSSTIGRWIFGSEEGDSVVRAGGAMAYNRPGMSDFTGVFGANQGLSVATNRDSSNLTNLPALFRNVASYPLLTAPAVAYPIAPGVITNTVNVFDSNLQIPYTQSYSVGWQRKVGRDSAVEVRYVGSRHRSDWETVNMNEININTNGFVNEFRKAQANLQANIAAGKGATFAYTGAAGTSPLPIFLAYLNGSNAPGDASKYTGSNWTNTTYLGFLSIYNPNPFGFANTSATNGFVGNATLRNNAIAAGLPANFFVANPDLIGGANFTTNEGGTNNQSIQVEYRKRFSHGLQFNTSYAWGHATVIQRYGFQSPAAEILQTGQVGGVQHAFKANWLYELPFGRERRWGSHVGPVTDAVLGGWEFDGVARIQTGEQLDFGDVRLVGMTADDFRKAINLRVDPVTGQLFILPQDIIDNTVKAFATSPTSSTGYGSLGPPTGRYLAPANGPDCIETSPSAGACGVRSLVVNGPPLFRFDLSAVKRFRIHGDVTFEFRAEMLNAFNSPYFNPVTTNQTTNGLNTTFTAPAGAILTGTPTTNATAPSSSDGFRLTSLLGDNTSRIIQFVWRVRW